MWFESTAAHQLLLIQSSAMNQMLIINDAPKPDMNGEAGLRLFGAKPVLVSALWRAAQPRSQHPLLAESVILRVLLAPGGAVAGRRCGKRAGRLIRTNVCQNQGESQHWSCQQEDEEPLVRPQGDAGTAGHTDR